MIQVSTDSHTEREKHWYTKERVWERERETLTLTYYTYTSHVFSHTPRSFSHSLYVADSIPSSLPNSASIQHLHWITHTYLTNTNTDEHNKLNTRALNIHTHGTLEETTQTEHTEHEARTHSEGDRERRENKSPRNTHRSIQVPEWRQEGRGMQKNGKRRYQTQYKTEQEQNTVQRYTNKNEAQHTREKWVVR